MDTVQDVLKQDCGLSNMGRCTDTFGPRKGIVRRTDEGKPICRRSERGRCVLTDSGKQMTRRERIAKRGVGGFTGTDVASTVIDGLTSMAQGVTGRQGRRVRRGRSLPPPSRRRRRRLFSGRRKPSMRGRKSSRDRSRSRRAPRRKRDRDKLFRGTTAVVAILGTLAALRMINNKKKDQSQLPPPRAQQRRRRSSKKKKRRRSRKRKK